VFQPFSRAADLNSLPPLARKALEPVTVDWPHEIARLQDWTKLVPDPVLLTRPDWSGGLPEVDVSRIWGTYFIESAKSGRLKADELSRVMTECSWTADDLAAFWDRLDRETADRAREPDVAGQVLAAIEQAPQLKDAFGEGASIDALFGLAQVKLFARKLPEARTALEAVLARLPEKTEAAHPSRGVAAYRMAQSYEFASDFETAREWYLKCAEWGTPEKTGGYDVRSEGYVEAARMCRRLGRDDEATTYYRKAVDECGQWGQAVASMDLCGLLMKANKPDEAIAVLEPLTSGANGPVPAVYALLTIARLRCDQGDSAAARDCAHRALELQASVTDAQALAMLAWAPDQAARLLSQLDTSDRQPVTVHPGSLLFTTDGDDPAPPAGFLVVTVGLAALTVSGPEWLDIRPLGRATPEGTPVRRAYVVALRGGTAAEGADGEIVVTAEGHPDRAAHLAVKVRPTGLEVSPRECFFGFLKPGDRREERVVIRDMRGKPFTVRQCRMEGTGADCGEPLRVAEGEWRVTVSVAPAAPGVIEARLVVVTDRDGSDQLLVPIRAHALPN
jgi:tetratricopeptide (TPR) repeat protein